MFCARHTFWLRLSNRSKLLQAKPYCTTKPTNTDKAEPSASNYDEAYRQLDKLDFTTAAKILFTDPPKKKKFGIDFHLVQLFFVCMPSLAVYLVAQYARYEMRKMDADLEQKKKQEEEAKAKGMESNVSEDKEAGFDPELLEVKVRLEKLEEAVKEIVVESKKHSGSGMTKIQDNESEKKHIATNESSNTRSRSESRSSGENDHLNNQKSVESTPGLGIERVSGSARVDVASQHYQKGKTQNGGPSGDAKK